MRKISKGKVLLIADPHQDIRYVESCLKEDGDADTVVFLGDWFDTFEDVNEKSILSIKSTCKYINALFESGRDIVWLLGNHDIAYFSSFREGLRPVKNSFYSCSGYTEQKAWDFNKHISKEWIRSNQLCCMVGDFVVSHAGFHPLQLGDKNLEISLEDVSNMYESWEKDKGSFTDVAYHWIYRVGRCRFGYDAIGSPVWLDWHREFKPLDSFKQVVGHTTTNLSHNPKEGNYCIDEMQNCYAVWENGLLNIKRIN